MKPRIRVKALAYHLGQGVPYDARPGDLVVGNRGAAARVYVHIGQFGSAYLLIKYAGNYDRGTRPDPGCRVHNFR